ncbi:F-box protein CPR1-like [Quercus suber]|uniref:F-box protein CPR1-like n=1 Tax=Quercus suber TaxID=58331 RepID=UPI000CE1E162|nr:F-box protein CPR1-like [Quercus suber]
MTEKELCTFVYNSDRTLTEVSRFRNPFYDHDCTLTEVSRFPICFFNLFDYCNGVFLFYNCYCRTICLWNPSIQKFRMIAASANHFPNCYITLGLAYHSANNDFKILLIAVAYGGIDGEQAPPTEAEIYTLSTDSWRRAVISVGSEPNIGSHIRLERTYLFFNGALHSLASTQGHNFILSFDVNEETFRKIMLPQDYINNGLLPILDLSADIDQQQQLAVFKGSLALIDFPVDRDIGDEIWHIWVMREYGVFDSWTKLTTVALSSVERFFGCTDSGELLVKKLF